MKQTTKKQFKKPFQKTKSVKWNQVKLEENVFTEDNLTFDGFVNLEVLENYDTRLVKRVRQSRDDVDLRALDRLPKKPKKSNVIEIKPISNSDEEDIFAEFDESDLPPLKKKKKLDNDDDNDKKTTNKKPQHQKQHVPGQFVLLKPKTNKKRVKTQVEEKDTDDDLTDPPNLINVQVSYNN